MRQYMPGDHGWVDKGPRIMNTFDQTWSTKVPQNIRDYVEKEEEKDYRYVRPVSEEPYLDALRDFFEDKIALMPPKARQDLGAVKDRIASLMDDPRSFEDKAKELGVSKQAIQQAQQRAVDQLVESVGGKQALADKLRQYLFDKEGQDGRERLKYLPRWVHG